MSEDKKEKAYSKEKKDDDTASLPYQNIQKVSVLQESRCFNESQVNARKCISQVLKILYLLGQGETLNQQEATDLFFSVSKLFISQNSQLKRLIFVLLKELAKTADQTFVASAILFKEMNQNTNNDYQANAIRTLAAITDEATINQLDRHLKQAVVSSNPCVASSALMSGLLLSHVSEEMIKRWAGEIQSVLKSPPKNSRMVQYHALAVQHHLKQNDPLALSKLISSNTSSFRSPLAHCLMIKYTLKILKTETSFSNERCKSLLSYLENCLNFENDMVVLEAARAMCSLEQLSQKELTPAVTALETFLSNNKQVNKFAALRTLNSLASKYPLLVSLCNNELDSLISDSNRNIATLAITTLLKTGEENNIDRLMKQISNFMHDISDEFKVTLIQEMKSLCLKYHSKYLTILNFLNTSLREETGGFEFKKAVIDAVVTIISSIKESKDAGIAFLCEFIEDCEFPLLLQQVLNFLGEEGPSISTPSKCIRYIYNRLLLEKAPVRASAISTLAKFGAKVQELRKSIIVILTRALQDIDDDVRDKASFYLRILQSDDKLIKEYIIDDLVLPIDKLEIVVEKYKQVGDFKQPLVIGNLNNFIIEKKEKVEEKKEVKEEKIVQKETNSTSILLPEAFKDLGLPLKTCKALQLTEHDSDYVVSCIKHIYEKFIIFQFNCTNKVNDSVIENVGMKLDISIDNIKEKYQLKSVKIPYESTGSVYVCCARNPNAFPLGLIPCKLTFLFKNVDSEGEILDEEVDEDEYKVEKLKLTIIDYLRESTDVNFKEEWEAIQEDESSENYSVNATSLQDAVDKMIDIIGIKPLNERQVSKKSSHSLFFSGVFTNGNKAFLQLKISEKDSKYSCHTLIKSDSIDLKTQLLNTIKVK